MSRAAASRAALHWHHVRICGILPAPGPLATHKEDNQLVRISHIIVDEAQLERYKSALKEEVEASVKLEAGVLTLYAVSARENPTHFTILEIYADAEAYEAHLKTPHFMKYKASTKDMVKSLELIDSVPLVPEMKIK